MTSHIYTEHDMPGDLPSSPRSRATPAAGEALLAGDEPAPVLHVNPEGRSPCFITCDHAGRLIPKRLGDLGVPPTELERHIAWDIGALGVARELARLLDAELVAQRYSRLVIDCNRPPDSPDLCTPRSEATEVPGNRGLSIGDISLRRAAIWQPYHDAIAARLEARATRPTVYVAIHSFTPVYLGRARPWQVGVLYGEDRRLATPMLEFLRAHGDFVVGENEPYRIDEKDQGIPAHALARGLPNVLIELRQDLITHAAGQQAWAARLAATLRHACVALQL
ncbi:MAG: N-formylglutamate amidohydrolase [Gammaproteobacteria bacterium]